ncbi:[FeFe] hydrogenase H-cluster maturation GTPase HydF [Saccharicrinis sp. FJH62]|uniref:[FeFe] hydrogenase H-cluster maturation GTPase HydF n=1 Tax=Saccharicrinis sp. FJH62 TaxID=3344657 RepID=UPI0035D49DB9
MKGRELKPHIGIFGRRNYGKSSIINVLTGQDIAIVSDTPGTTTDPVKKSIEIHGIGPVILVDTAGIDDSGSLGEQRIKKTRQAIQSIDLGLIVINNNEIGEEEVQLFNELYDYGVPALFIHNKSDIEPLNSITKHSISNQFRAPVEDFSAVDAQNTEHLIHAIKKAIPATAYQTPSMLGDLLSYGDIVLLIIPIDIEAPDGRLILPQVQAIRDILDNDSVAIVLKEREVDAFLKKTGIKPKLAVTDSSIFLKADASIPKDIPLTGFSIVLARFKGNFPKYLEGTPKISDLKDGDRILLLESCTHHVSCDDIGRVKIPRWISNFTGKQLEYDIVSGLNKLERPITDYALVIQCGGCMITRKQLINRLKPAIDAGIPVTNYGMSIAWVQGIYNRAIAPFVKSAESVEDYL